MNMAWPWCLRVCVTFATEQRWVSVLTSPPSKDLWLVDSSIYVFKYWYTLPDSLRDRDGLPINAVLGFLDFVLRLLQREQPQAIAFAFDTSLASSHRNEIYPAYKANREPAPEELKRQFKLCRQFLRSLGLAEFASPRYEADDIIGTLAKRGRQQGRRITIVSADKDLTQLIHEGDLWWEYSRDLRLDCAGVEKQFGVRPDQIADLLALAGDKVDNIPGIPGIGKVTAAKLLRRFDHLDRLLASIDEIPGTKIRGAQRIARLLKEHQAEARLARQLTDIVCHIPDTDLESPPAQAMQYEPLIDLFDRLNFRPGLRQQWLNLPLPDGISLS